MLLPPYVNTTAVPASATLFRPQHNLQGGVLENAVVSFTATEIDVFSCGPNSLLNVTSSTCSACPVCIESLSADGFFQSFLGAERQILIPRSSELR